MTKAVSLVEVEPFTRQVSSFLSEAEQEELKWYLANNPTDGVLIQGTGGVRKLRWAAKGRGKSGGSRIIYFFHSDASPIWLLAAYSKNAKVDLTQKEKAAIRKLVSVLVAQYQPGDRNDHR